MKASWFCLCPTGAFPKGAKVKTVMENGEKLHIVIFCPGFWREEETIHFQERAKSGLF